MEERIHSIKDLVRPQKPDGPKTSGWVEKFLSRIQLDESTGCWNWVGPMNNVTQYGMMSVCSRHVNAHRLSWIFFNGEIPHGNKVLHKCDNRRCVNFNHLFLGDQLANIRDCISKGRFIRGESHANSTISREQVYKIRELVSSGLMQKDVAAMFSINKSTVCEIVSKKSRAFD